MGGSLLWFRQDLRLADNPALVAALQQGPVLPVYILDPAVLAKRGAASKVWLHHSLQALDAALQASGNRLLVCQGDTAQQLAALVQHYQLDQIVCQHDYTPDARRHEKQLHQTLKAAGIAIQSFQHSLLLEPWQVKTKTGGPYKVFTPFWRNAQNILNDVSPPLPAPEQIPGPQRQNSSTSLPPEAWGLLPTIRWDKGMMAHWQVGEAAAAQKLQAFFKVMADYHSQRDLPDQTGTSQLSPHLHFGEISPRQIWQAAMQQPESEGSRIFLNEIGWREFAYHVLWHFPDTPREALNAQFKAFPWADNQQALKAWQQGLTGYPIVDAGMRQLWQTGWMHNRVRMIVASFLTKHLLQPWQSGADWFWGTLVDADLASNTLGWQWAGGCGADAAPYFRIFNPITQGQKFDARGQYVRRWVPELAGLPDKWLHEPWAASPLVLQAAGVQLGGNYPAPIIEHSFARQRALAALAQIKKA